MTPAETVIKAFGGDVRRLADLLGVQRVTVYRWTYPKTKRGGGGIIPQEYFMPILDAAKKAGIHMTVEHLVLGKGNNTSHVYGVRRPAARRAIGRFGLMVMDLKG